MKRFSIILLIVIVLLTFGGSYAYSKISMSGISELSGSIDVDSEGRYYMLGNTSTQFKLLRINNANVMDYYYSTPINTADTMVMFGDIFADQKSNSVYTVKNILDNKSNLFVSSNIVCFDMSSKKSEPRTIYEQKFDNTASSGNHHIKYIYPHEDFLYFTTVNEDLRSVNFCRVNINNALSGLKVQPDTILTFKLPGISLANKTLCGKDFLIVQTMDSKIYHIDSKGTEKLIFPTKDYSGRYYPTNLCLDNEGTLYFNEVYSHDMISVNISSGDIISVTKGDTPISPGSSYFHKDISSMSVLSRDIKAVLVEPGGGDLSPIPLVLQNGEARPLVQVEPSRFILLYSTSMNALIVLLILAIFFAVIKLFHFGFSHKPSLLMKLITFVLPIIIIAMFFFSRVATYIFDNSITAERMKLVKNVGNYVAENIDTKLLSNINNSQDISTEAYDKLLRSISKYSDFSEFFPEDPDYIGLYCVLMKVEKDRIYTAVSADMPFLAPLETLYSKESINLYNSALKKKNMVSGTIQDVQGIWTVSILPVFDTKGEIIGMLETGINSKDLEASILNLSRSMLLSGILVSIAVLFAFLIAMKILLRPLALLKEAVVSVYKGNYGTVAVIKAHDEVADIGRVFNKLSLELNSQFDKLTSLNKAYYKIIPPDIFSLLNKSSILDVNLGDQVSIKMTIMSASIRNFERIASGLSPEITFRFINHIFKIISSNTGNHSGIIHSYNVDKVSVLFQSSSEKALESIICIRSELAAKNNSEFLKNGLKVDAGFYIHTTPCIYGIIGDENRYSPAVVAENNDIIYSLDSLQHNLMCSILVTQSAYDEISEPGSYNHRYIGYMTGENNSVQIGLYEFFDGDEPHVLAGKKHTLDLFDSAISEYLNQDFYRARNLFAQIVKVNTGDTVARWFLFKCDSLCKYTEDSDLELAIAKY